MNSFMILRYITVCIFSAAISVTALSDVYSWTDSEGNVHFADTIPSSHTKELESIKIGKINAISDSHTIRTIAELEAAGIEITPQLRSQAREEEARRASKEQAAIDDLNKDNDFQAQRGLDEQQRQFEQAQQDRQDQAVSDTCGRRSASSREKQRCIDSAKKVEEKCAKPNQSQRQKYWCERNYNPSDYH